jgi:large subunit ribosomal protein L21
VRCAIIKTGGKQYRISEGEIIMVEKLPGETGEKVQLGQVLMIKDGDQVYWGNPCLEGGWVSAQILQQDRAKKIIVFKHKRRKNYRKKQGHRQYFTKLRIENISLGSPVLEETNEEFASTQEPEVIGTIVAEEPTENMVSGEVIENGS